MMATEQASRSRRSNDRNKSVRDIDDHNRNAAPLYLAGDAILSRAKGAALVERLLSAFKARPEAPLRQRLDMTGGRELLVMPAALGRYAGVKTLAVIPENSGTARPVINGLFTLFDLETGDAVANLDSSALTAVRTAAVSAAASSRLSRPDSDSLVVLGAGHLAPYLADAHAGVRPLRRVRFWARRPEQAGQAAARLRDMRPDLDIAVEVSLEHAIRSADIVSAATRATAPLIHGEWLSAGTHVDLVGGYRPDMREIDDVGIKRSELFVDSRTAALNEAGDLIDPLARGAIGSDHVRGELADIAMGDAARSSPDAITLFKAVGTAMADLVAAVAIWEAGHDGSRNS